LPISPRTFTIYHYLKNPSAEGGIGSTQSGIYVINGGTVTHDQRELAGANPSLFGDKCAKYVAPSGLTFAGLLFSTAKGLGHTAGAQFHASFHARALAATTLNLCAARFWFTDGTYADITMSAAIPTKWKRFVFPIYTIPSGKTLDSVDIHIRSGSGQTAAFTVWADGAMVTEVTKLSNK